MNTVIKKKLSQIKPLDKIVEGKMQVLIDKCIIETNGVLAQKSGLKLIQQMYLNYYSDIMVTISHELRLRLCLLIG